MVGFMGPESPQVVRRYYSIIGVVIFIEYKVYTIILCINGTSTVLTVLQDTVTQKYLILNLQWLLTTKKYTVSHESASFI